MLSQNIGVCSTAVGPVNRIDLDPTGRALSLSVVIPVFNEAENLESLSERLVAVLNQHHPDCEVIFVDDGSRDGSDQKIREICDRNLCCVMIRFRRNFGQTAALAAGLRKARGQVIVTMDADGQNDPADIPSLVQKLDEGYDLVNGWRKKRQDPWLNRLLPSRLANSMIALITGLHLHDFGCSLKAMRRDIAQELKLYGEMHRFIPAIASQIGARVTEIEVQHHPRTAGKSKYGIGRTLRVILDLITVKFLSEFSTRPSHLFGLVGLFALIIGSTITGLLVLEKLILRHDIGGRPLLLLSVFLTIVGIQFITMGLIGEMLSRIYHESQRKPIYSVREIYRGKANARIQNSGFGIQENADSSE